MSIEQGKSQMKFPSQQAGKPKGIGRREAYTRLNTKIHHKHPVVVMQYYSTQGRRNQPHDRIIINESH